MISPLEVKVDFLFGHQVQVSDVQKAKCLRNFALNNSLTLYLKLLKVARCIDVCINVYILNTASFMCWHTWNNSD